NGSESESQVSGIGRIHEGFLQRDAACVAKGAALLRIAAADPYGAPAEFPGLRAQVCIERLAQDALATSRREGKDQQVLSGGAWHFNGMELAIETNTPDIVQRFLAMHGQRGRQ